MTPSRHLLLFLVLVSTAAAAAPVTVTFVVNDAFVKDRMLPGTAVAVRSRPDTEPLVQGSTDGNGRFSTPIEPGTYLVSYQRPGFVSILDSETVLRTDGQVVTTTLSQMLESGPGAAEGGPLRRIRVILNWGSDRDRHVPDVDSHMYCPCHYRGCHVYFSEKNHGRPDHKADLDVDDTDWGGPETITVTTPTTGAYEYWVHDYTSKTPTLGGSDVVVRVLFDDMLAGEYRVPTNLSSRDWRPFKAIEVGADGAAWVVPFEPAEISQGDDRRPPNEPPMASPPGGDDDGGDDTAEQLVALLVLFGLIGIRIFAALSD